MNLSLVNHSSDSYTLKIYWGSTFWGSTSSSYRFGIWSTTHLGHSGGLQAQATAFGCGQALIWGSTLWGLQAPAIDFGTGQPFIWGSTLWGFTGVLHSVGLQAPATDFGSGQPHIWVSRLAVYWRSTLWRLQAPATDFGSGHPNSCPYEKI